MENTNQTIPGQWESIIDMGHVIVVEDKQGLYGLLDSSTKQELLPCDYHIGDEYGWTEPLVVGDVMVIGDHDHKYGLYNLKTHLFDVPCQWGIGDVLKENNGIIVVGDRNGKYGLYDLKIKKIVVPYLWDEIFGGECVKEYGLYSVMDSNKKWGLLNSDTFEMVLPCVLNEPMDSYYELEDEYDGIIIVKDNKNKYGIFDINTRKLVVPFIWDDIMHNACVKMFGFYSVKDSNGKWGLLNAKTFEPIAKCTLDYWIDPEYTQKVGDMVFAHPGGQESGIMINLKTMKTMEFLREKSISSSEFLAKTNGQHNSPAKVSDLSTLISVETKFRFMSELFLSNLRNYKEFIWKLNHTDNMEDAMNIVNEAAEKNKWDMESPVVKDFFKVFDRKF